MKNLKSTNKDVVKIIVYEAPPFFDKGDLNYLLLETATGPYVDAIKNLTDEQKTVQKILVDNSILFFDLLMLPIPIDSKLRRKWSTSDSFKIDGLQLPVVLLELNLNHFKNELKENLSLKPTFALGMPHLTALSIYNYVSSNESELISDFSPESLKKINSLDVKNRYQKKVVPLFKSCFVNASNNPDADLLQNAFAD